MEETAFLLLQFTEAQAVTAQQMGYGVGTGGIFMNNVWCTKQDTEFIFCNFDATTRDCTHTRDAGVVCKPRGRSSVYCISCSIVISVSLIAC